MFYSMGGNVFFFYIFKIILFYSLYIYLNLILFYCSKSIILSYDFIFKKYHFNNSKFKLFWYNYIFIYFYIYIILLAHVYSVSIFKIFIFFLISTLIVNFNIFVNLNFFFFKKIPNVFFLFLVLFLFIFDNLNYNILFFYISIEYLSICTCGYLSYFDNNYVSVLLYLWSSIFSAILSAILIFCCFCKLEDNFIFLIIYFYFSTKIGLLPIGYWLYFFYKKINLSLLIPYLSSFYILNIIYVYLYLFLLMNFFNLSISYIIMYKGIFLTLNTIFLFILFINNYNLKLFFFYNTIITSTVIFSIL